MTDDPQDDTTPEVETGTDDRPHVEMGVTMLNAERWAAITEKPVAHYMNELDDNGLFYAFGVSSGGEPQMIVVAQGVGVPMVGMALWNAGIIEEEDEPKGVPA